MNYYAGAKLVCNVTGIPTPRIKWKFTNVRKDYLTFMKLQKNLYIKNLFSVDTYHEGGVSIVKLYVNLNRLL